MAIDLIETQVMPPALSGTAISALRGQVLRVSPCSGWQSFFVDLWRALEGPGLMRMELANEIGARDQLRLSGLGSEWLLSRTLSQEWLQHVLGEELQSGEIRLENGMICLQRQSMYQVIAVQSELRLPREEWLDLVVMALQWAVWQGASPDRLRGALSHWCMGERSLQEVHRFGKLRFLSGAAFRTQEEVARVLQWNSERVLVILGGNFWELDHRLEEALTRRNATLIHLLGHPRKQESLLRRLIDVYAVTSMEEAVRRVYELVEEELEVICFPAIDCSEQEAQQRASAWCEEVQRG